MAMATVVTNRVIVRPPAVERPLFAYTALDGAGLRALGGVVLLALVFISALPSLPGSWLPGDREFAGLRTPESGIMALMMPATRWPDVAPGGAMLVIAERAAFGDSAAAWRVVSLGLHAAVVLSLWRLFASLRMPGCWLAAAFFAVLPVQADAVAAVRNQPVLLAGLLCVGSLRIYLRAIEIPSAALPADAAVERARWRIILSRLRGAICRPLALNCIATLLAALAGLTHLLTAGLPLAILVLVAGRRGRLTLRDLLNVLPLAVVSITLGIASQVYWPTIPAAMLWKVTAAGQVLARFEAAGFYLSDCLWPLGHATSYPDWNLDYVVEFFFLIGWLFFMVIAWLTRESIGRVPVMCGALVVLLSLPIVTIGPWRVSDAMAYFATAAVAAGLGGAVARLPRISNGVRRAIGIVLVILLVGMFGRRACVYADAKLGWDEVLSRSPEWPPALAGRAEYELCVARDVEGAERDFRELLEIEPTSAYALLGLARVAQYKRGWSDSEQLLYQAAGLAPRDVWILDSLALAIERGGNVDSGAEEYTKALKLSPDDPMALNGLARIAAGRGDLIGAAITLGQLVDTNPWFVPGWFNLAIIRGKQNRPDEAASLFDRACQIEPSSSEAWLAAGTYYAEAGKYELAIEKLRRALSEDFNNAQAFVELGLVLDTQHDSNCVNCMNQAARIEQSKALADRARELEGKYFPQTGVIPQVTEPVSPVSPLSP
jgi:tetratricopeptide (TPR) repeat protein